MNEISNLIATLGFPMIACIYVYADSRKDKNRLYDTIDKFGDKLDNFDKTLNEITQELKELRGR